MKKLLLLLLAASFCMLSAQQQVPVSKTEVHPVSGEPLRYCGTDEATSDLYKQFPHLKEEVEMLEKEEQNQKKNLALNSPPVYKIPVVVHILHNYGPENIPDANVKDAIRILNEDFRKMNTDISQVVTAFQGITGDAEIEFELARLDPNGNCTNGINRIATPKTYKANDQSKINMWPRNKYLNIWTVNSIGSGAAGYTYLPATVHSQPSIDGIIILYNYFGSLAPSTLSTGRALTHEVGHWLNLLHCWGSTNQPGVQCGDDGVSDTPVTKGWTSCNLTNNKICNPSIEENVQNFMEYAYCYRMFTVGQCTRMRTALQSSTAERNNLWSSSNLAATGLSSPATLCKADFKATKTVVCVGTNITFTDLSWNKTPTSWQWDFDNNGTTDATTQNPTHSYSAPGVYSVKLTVSDGSSTQTETKTSYITVLANTSSKSAPFSEGFEATGYPYNDWYNTSASNNSNTWTRVTTAAYSGSASLKLDNHSPTSGDIDEFITPSIDMSTVTSPTMTFRVAYARRNATDTLDKLRVLTSTNCGGTWTQRYIKDFSTLPTSANTSAAFTPTSPSQWRQDNVNIANVNGQSNVRFKFEFTGHGTGNNIYIDDINITGTPVNPGINEEFINRFGLNVYPNPFHESAVISFSIHDKYNVGIGVYDVIGKEIIPVSEKTILNAGNYELPLNSTLLKPGVYFVKLWVEEYSVTKKIVVQ